LSAALAACALLSAAQAQVIPFSGNFGRGLARSDNQMVFESVAYRFHSSLVSPFTVRPSVNPGDPVRQSVGAQVSYIIKVSRGEDRAVVPPAVVAYPKSDVG
jgi:hypothetical protein